ncbi:alpha/beta fold hydrolase [Membranicola marinus]|uniref:Alpha/beta fold hydrolase n=1 Tax=Membranihabitans marinus TaxID=1227546 RepID=A0A953LED8_9BACT|nr:bifunctional alpha/beta hydrolase/OsmC family protein [Membranihabitans marinus]MBY5959849.1 alpha/beta fold hydrolase [Membranihabitans marinus]
MKSKKISFQNQHGEQLSARIEFPPEGQIKSYAIFAHCFTCGKNAYAARHVARQLALHNVAVMRFDFTGIGESEGAFSQTNFTSNVSDIIEAAGYLSDHYEPASLLIGHSWGGTAALVAAGELDEIKGVCTIGSPYDPSHIDHILSDHLEEINQKGHAQIQLGPNSIRIKRQFLDDIQQHSHMKGLEDLKKPLLIFHSPQDRVVGIQNAAQIYKAAHHPKSFLSLDQSDHMLSEKRFVHYTAAMIANWADHHLGIQPETSPAVKTPYQTISRISEPGYTTQIWSGNHHWIADEPLRIGGENLGPTPYDMLSAALGTCTAMTLRMYANRKKWDLKEVEVHVENNKEHADDLPENDKKKAKIDVFRRYIEVKGALDQQQIDRLLEIADKCPVHKTLSTTNKIITELIK